ncbi:F-box/LRR-repeat protein 12 [Ornithorhynchus anatinus]|nr:F-box/LRR-repeat protein 12 [Ornithorhynchus anatinus]
MAEAEAERLPDWLLLEILSFLPLGDRVRSARVCRRWRRLVQDKTLWKNVDLTPYPISPKVLWILLRRYLGPGLQSLKVRGSLPLTPRPGPLSSALLVRLSHRCPRLSSLSLQDQDLRSLPFSCLPRSLRVLELQRCELPANWFSSLGSPALQLERLSLDRVPSFSNRQLEAVCQLPGLRVLKLVGTYRITPMGVRGALAGGGGKELEALQLWECALPAETMKNACQVLPRLQVLEVDGIAVQMGLEECGKNYYPYRPGPSAPP